VVMLHGGYLGVIDAITSTVTDGPGYGEWLGCKTVVGCGDFRQTLPIIRHASKAALLSASVRKSEMRPRVDVHSLTHNFRAVGDAQYAAWVLQLGNNAASRPEEQPADPPRVAARDWLLDGQDLQDAPAIAARAMLCPHNATSVAHNEALRSLWEGVDVIALAFHQFKEDTSNAAMATEEYMASITDYGAPAAKLVLRTGMLLMIMRNMTLCGLSNGSKVKLIAITSNLLTVETVGAARCVFIPRYCFDVKGGASSPCARQWRAP